MKRILFGSLYLASGLCAQSQTATPEQKDFFENRIRPMLAQQCFACHTNSQMGGLRVDSLQGLLKGGKSGPAIVPGDPDSSRLITAVRQTTELKMPKNGHLTDAQITDLTTWVKSGAVWPETVVAKTQGYTIRPDQRDAESSGEVRASGDGR